MKASSHSVFATPKIRAVRRSIINSSSKARCSSAFSVRIFVKDFVLCCFARNLGGNLHVKSKDLNGPEIYLGSAELISSHRQRVADVAPLSDDNDEKTPDFGQGKTKFPQELHHVFNEVAHSRPASCCIWKLGSYVIGSIDSLASTE